MRSAEEEAELCRSTKKVKESHHRDSQTNPLHATNLLRKGTTGPSDHSHENISFKDKLLGEIPGAYAQAFDFTEFIDNGMDSNSEVEALKEGVAAVKLSRETIHRIRAPWSKALIIKVFGRSIGFNYLHSKILSLWKPKGKIDCVDLESDYFLIKFSLKEDYDLVLSKGPWFIGEHFLLVRPWEANFDPGEANIASIVVWLRLP